jgi:hypothetical protein
MTMALLDLTVLAERLGPAAAAVIVTLAFILFLRCSSERNAAALDQFRATLADISARHYEAWSVFTHQIRSLDAAHQSANEQRQAQILMHQREMLDQQHEMIEMMRRVRAESTPRIRSAKETN